MNLKLSAAIAAAIATPQAFADATSAVGLAPLVVTATRVEQSSFDVPGAIDVISAGQIRDGQLGVNLSESLWRAPGTVVLNRQNYAQDLQVSMRGFGARSAFGTRSIRLMQDGIPLTMPDGQGQTATFDLANAQRIEVLRGPFAAGYGNQSGGVIQVFTADGPKEPSVSADVSAGSFGTRNLSLKAGGQAGNVNYTADSSEFHTDGYRVHGAATRDSANAKLKLALADGSTLTLLGNWLRQAGTQDPQGLTQAQFDLDPRQVSSNTLLYNTRKDIAFLQGGAVLDQRLAGGDALRFSAYAGKRQVTQFQSIPASAQLARTSPGGVVAFDRDYAGAGARWNRVREDWKLSAGLDYESMQEARKGYNNTLGAAYGVIGALRRDEGNRVNSVNSWVEGEWRFSPAWSATGGVRNTRVSFSSADHYLLDGVDGTGGVSFQNTSPVLGILWRASPALNFFANFGRGFETPTFTEMSYQPNNAPGLNFGLKPSTSRSAEAGMKAFPGANSRLEATLFDVETSDEIVVLSAGGGRTYYTNAGRTGRQGVEVSWDAELGHGFGAFAAYTRMKAVYRDGFGQAPNVALAGNTIAGTPTTLLRGELSWKHAPTGFTSALELHHVGQIFANDTNTAAAGGYDVASLRLGLAQQAGHWSTKEFLRCDNLTDRKYVGSVIVNDSNAQYFEPAPGRNWSLGASASYRF
ncbi:MAG: TonB-dependent receptor [Rhodocyclaceae bacterium]|nr:TonB-dependent receptor [Rhodocyclaceae bacterium]